MRIFSEGSLRDLTERQLAAMRSEIQSEEKNRLLNMNEEEYVEYLVQKYSLEPLAFLWDDLYVTDQEAMIPAEMFPRSFNVYPGKRYSKQVVTYHVPFEGDRELLRYTPSSRIMWSTEVDVHSDSISFNIINWRDDPEEIKRDADAIMSHIRTQHQNVAQEVAQFNAGLRAVVQAAVQARKQQHLKESNLLANLGVPVKKSPRTPGTFSVPSIKKKIIVKPTAPDTAFTPEPTLDVSLYKEILLLCHDTGVEMERHPSIYADKDEDTLRDHFIMVLSPHFDSVTGETFNRLGKTDILIRHEGANVFVAECKFWGGAKKLHGTIDQVLGYLTWRDSKAAILNFVRNKELDPVLRQVAPAAAEHPCFVSSAPPDREGWFNFKFHLPNDKTRGVSLAVLCFHLPPQ